MGRSAHGGSGRTELPSAAVNALRLAVGLAALLVTASLAATTGSAAPSGSFTYRGTVTRVLDGDTVDVRLTSGKVERVRLVGIDSAERGACYSSQATAQARRLALSKPVVLRGDRTQATRDRYRRLLAYVWIPGGKDLGYQLLSGGFAKVYVYNGSRFERLAAYRGAEAGAQGRGAGRWAACAAAPIAPISKPVPPRPPAPDGNCHTSYSPCLPVVGDLDCADVRALGKAPVRALGEDPYRLDGDGDGYGCE
jgi:micrococcal nuclease